MSRNYNNTSKFQLERTGEVNALQHLLHPDTIASFIGSTSILDTTGDDNSNTKESYNATASVANNGHGLPLTATIDLNPFNRQELPDYGVNAVDRFLKGVYKRIDYDRELVTEIMQVDTYTSKSCMFSGSDTVTAYKDPKGSFEAYILLEPETRTNCEILSYSGITVSMDVNGIVSINGLGAINTLETQWLNYIHIKVTDLSVTAYCNGVGELITLPSRTVEGELVLGKDYNGKIIFTSITENNVTTELYTFIEGKGDIIYNAIEGGIDASLSTTDRDSFWNATQQWYNYDLIWGKTIDIEISEFISCFATGIWIDIGVWTDNRYWKDTNIT